MQKCLICDSGVNEFMDFGRMPLGNGFLDQSQFTDEYFYNLKVGFCSRCTMVQLLEQPAREQMFHDHYAYISSISSRMSEHFKSFAHTIMDKYLIEPDPLVVEIGSNDGIMLQHFAAAGIRHLGVEPSTNVAKLAGAKGIETVCEFFDERLAETIKGNKGQADAILAANVMCHIPYLHSVAAGISRLLKPKGVLIFEDPYLADILEITSYDQIYDEHVFYFSLSSVQYLFGVHGMEVIDIMPQNVHGGSMRYTVARKGAFGISPDVGEQLLKEEHLGLKRDTTYHHFREKVEMSKNRLMTLLLALRNKGRRVVGYGATSKSTTVMNYCGITPDHIEYISDTTHTKQGKFTPGMHIPVKHYKEFCEHYPDVALLFAWNHGEEIMNKEKMFQDGGGRWLVYVPQVKIL